MIRHDDLRYEPHLALALGGGGALGAAHVGVLQVLHERGITPSIVVGTSIGAVIGAAYASELDPYELERLVLDAEWGNFGTFSMAPSLGLLNTEGLRASIESVIDEELIENLPIRFGAVASNLAEGRSVLLDHGPLYPAVAASISVPGIFAPSKLDGHLLLDGGIYENLPLEAAFEMGARHVIGVRLAPEWDGPGTQRSSVKVHELEIRSDVTLVSPRLQHRSQWVKKDIPGLIRDGREAAGRALRDYAVVNPRPTDPHPTDPRPAAVVSQETAASDSPAPEAAATIPPLPPSSPTGVEGTGTAKPDDAAEPAPDSGLAAFFRKR
ncbi:patatin-like phospholipase family protein [Demequina aurantiaca]|uniref:patatin-like phospholipase family protein n=1 Tax=Demequina aurantiaca TaxID=676200 RepID=UPI003D339EAD